MSNLQAVILGVSIIIGFTILGAMRDTAPTAAHAGSSADQLMRLERMRHAHALELEAKRASAEKTLRLLDRGETKVLELEGRRILVDETWSKKGGSFSITTKYLELRDGRLVKIPVVESED